jgi:1-aminocyclopropane-1-carboxylate deaminase/D-cysteine desulfhydrase-like pyridoxal-dependent ACC family enzyme
MPSDLARLLEFPTVSVGHWPTPLLHMPRSGTPGILIKRDDLSGHGRGGVKTRKIEHLVGYMLANGYDELITVVANITNLVRDTVPVLQRLGLHWKIFIVNDPPLSRGDREQLLGDFRNDVHLLGPGHLGAVTSIVGAWRDSRRRGRKPFIALPSLMHPAGVVGTARGFLEMVSQVRAQGMPVPDTVFITVASGTTFAGFLLAEHALRSDGSPPIRIVGVQVYPGQARWWTLGLVRWTERFLGLRGHVPLDRIELVSSALYGGFGRYPDHVARLCLALQQESGIDIDPIFGGKTWSVMEQRLAGSSARDDRPMLYWHCGYTPDWQAFTTSAS